MQQEIKMKLYYSSDPVLSYHFLKIKSVITALNISNVVQEPKQLFVNLPQISTIPTLPLLVDQENKLQLASSNSIIRYLAETNGGKLYGNGNIFQKSLIDQWLDFCLCELDSMALAVELFLSGREVDIEIVFADAQKVLTGLNKGLNKKKYLVGDCLSIADVCLAITVSPIITHLYTELQRKKYTHIVNWFLGIAGQSKLIMPKALPPKPHIKIEKYKNKKEGKQDKGKNKEEKGKKEQKGKKEENKGKKGKKQQSQKKQEKKNQKAAADDDDLFGDDTQDKPKQAPKPQVVKKEPKKKAAAKSIVVFDVKVYDEEQDLQALFKKITSITLDGLLWNQECKILPVAYTMNKLQIGCVIQDEKVSVEEDIFEKIRQWDEEIQSVDTVSFQKL